MGYLLLAADGLALVIAALLAFGLFARGNDREAWQRRAYGVGALALLVASFGSIYLINIQTGRETGTALAEMVRFGGVLFLAVGWLILMASKAVSGGFRWMRELRND